MTRGDIRRPHNKGGRTMVFEIPTTELIKYLVPPARHQPHLYNPWLLERWKDEGLKRVILCRTTEEQQLCWSYGIPGVGTPIGYPFEEAKFLLSFPELVILEPTGGHETFGKAVANALKYNKYVGQVKVVRFPIETINERLLGSVKLAERGVWYRVPGDARYGSF